MWGPDADTSFRDTQTFLEIDRPRRLVTSSTGSDPCGMERDFFESDVWQGALARIEAYLMRGA